MGDFKNHKTLYLNFKKDAENTELYEGTRVESYFIAAFHVIETCAAKERVHINKHQRVREILQENKFIFNEDTEIVWKAFQKIENQLRPKFVYGFSWTEIDLDEVKKNFATIEDKCSKVIEK